MGVDQLRLLDATDQHLRRNDQVGRAGEGALLGIRSATPIEARIQPRMTGFLVTVGDATRH